MRTTSVFRKHQVSILFPYKENSEWPCLASALGMCILLPTVGHGALEEGKDGAVTQSLWGCDSIPCYESSHTTLWDQTSVNWWPGAERQSHLPQLPPVLCKCFNQFHLQKQGCVSNGLKREHASQSPGGLVKRQMPGPHPRVADAVGICISTVFPWK